jgi:hypothetical protein
LNRLNVYRRVEGDVPAHAGHDGTQQKEENPVAEAQVTPQQRAFLAAFRKTGNVRLACEAAKVGRSSHYRWLSQDPAYRDAFAVAKEEAADLLEAEAFRRAVHGWDEPVGWYKGKAGGVVKRYSDALLIVLLKALRPNRYKERVEMRGALANLDLNLLPDEAIDRIANGEHVMSVLSSIVPRAGEAVPGLLAPPEKPQ